MGLVRPDEVPLTELVVARRLESCEVKARDVDEEISFAFDLVGLGIPYRLELVVIIMI